MSQEQDTHLLRNYSLVIGALVALLVIFFVIARSIGIDEEADAKQRESMVAERTAPVGEVSVVGEEPVMSGEPAMAAADTGSSSGAVDGKQIHDGLCVACHGVPGIGAPVTGNADDWAPRIAKGMDTLYDHAINGFTGDQGFMMPARGGGDLDDEQVKAAVDYMVTESGGSVDSGDSAAAGGGDAVATTSGKSGEEVYNGLCVACHGIPGIGAPVMGNADDWSDRIAKGMDTLYDHAINGFTGDQGFMMPARGGGDFTDEEVKAAVDYMVGKSQ